jgi:hypothetical protein
LAEVRRLTPGPIRAGSEHVFVRGFAGRRLATGNRFTRYEPPRFVEFEVPDGWLVGRASYFVEPHPAGSLLVSSMDFQVRGPGRVLGAVPRRVLAHDASRDDERLAGLLGTTAPGRRDACSAPGHPATRFATMARRFRMETGSALTRCHAPELAARSRFRRPWCVCHPVLRRPRPSLDVLGFPTYGGGPFEDAGIQTSVPLLVSFLLVCVGEVAWSPGQGPTESVPKTSQGIGWNETIWRFVTRSEDRSM